MDPVTVMYQAGPAVSDREILHTTVRYDEVHGYLSFTAKAGITLRSWCSLLNSLFYGNGARCTYLHTGTDRLVCLP